MFAEPEVDAEDVGDDQDETSVEREVLGRVFGFEFDSLDDIANTRSENHAKVDYEGC